ncbi:ATP-binding cassette domain-containing protein [Jatrophihabitans fulvus]
MEHAPIATVHPDGQQDRSVRARVEHVAKAFGPTRALVDVSFELRSGEVLALVGENGAGKSTCVKLLGGVYSPDAGTVEVAGTSTPMDGPLDAQRRGVAVVNQHPALFGELSIAENIFAGRPLRTSFGVLDHARMRARAAELLRRLKLRRDPSTPASALRTSEQQMVEIARALASEASVIVLDEPTAALSSGEVETLFGIVEELRSSGVALLFVGHRLEEIFAISDRIAVLRDGALVATHATADLTPAETVRLMVGRQLTDLYPERAGSAADAVVLEVAGLSSDNGVTDVGLTIRAGEIVGLAGLVGSGRTEVARLLFGIDRRSAGRIEMDGRPVALRSPAAALARGIAYVSEDRRGQSLVEEFSILDNATLPVISRATRFGLVMKRAEMALVSSSLSQMNLKFSSYGQPVATLSGGNQQKVVLAKWLASNPRLLILDEPTQGIDVGAKAEVHRIIAGLADQGLAILLISSDMPEILGMSDRVLVMRQGRIAAEFARGEADQEAIGAAATGAAVDADHVGTTAPRTGVRATTRPAATTRDASSDRERPTPGRSPLVDRLRLLAARREAGLVAALAVMVVVITLVNSRFLSSTNLDSISGEASLVGFVAAGQLLVVLTRNIDVSVGSVIGLTAYLFGEFVKEHPNAPVVVGFLVAAGIGLACGLVNGLMVAYGGVPSIVVTLGTQYVFRGVDSLLSDGKEIAPGDIPQHVQDALNRNLFGPSALVWVTIAVFVVVGLALRWTTTGREIYQVGSNADGARLLGVPLQRRILLSFAVSGMLAGIGGGLWAAHYGIVDGQTAYGQELTVIAAVVVGGVALRGGFGTAAGVALGTMILFTIQNALELAKVDSDNLQAFYGAAIIVAVGFDLVVGRRGRRAKAVL